MSARHPALLFEFEAGSRLTGTNIEGSDFDRIAVFAEPPGRVTGVWPAVDSVQSKVALGDVTTHPLRKFAALAAQGNPNIVQGFFVPEFMLTADSMWGRAIRGSHHLFVSKIAADRFLGYAKSQRAKLAGEKNNPTTRPALAEQYGYDTKFAGHAYRIASQGVELMRTGRLTLPMPERQRRTTVDIRSGVYTREQAIQLIDEQVALLIAEAAVNDLPGQPDYIGINELLHEIHMDVWQDMGDPYAGIPRLS